MKRLVEKPADKTGVPKALTMQRNRSFLEVNMSWYSKPLWMAFFACAVLVGACVTINIYFPAEKVESVAEEIVSEVRGTDAEETDGPQEKEKQSGLGGTILVFWPASAWAEEVTTVSNASIRALKDAMKVRYQQLKPFYQKGILLEGNDGYLSLANSEGLGLKEKRDLNNLVQAENRDRQSLYEEVAKALNIDPSQTQRVAEIFAEKWQSHLP